MSEIRGTLTINGSSLAGLFAAAGSVLQDQIEAEMIEILRTQGWAVERPSTWETPHEISARLGIHFGTFSRKMAMPGAPKPFDVVHDGRGIAALRSHSVLDDYLRTKKPRVLVNSITFPKQPEPTPENAGK